MCTRRQHLGFKMLEMMIALAIVAILTAIAVPSFLYFSQENRPTLAAQNLYYTLQYARTEAIKQDTTIYVNFQTGANWCYGINAGSACNCATANSCGLGSTSAPNAQSTSLSLSGVTNNSITFEETRGATTAAAQITFTAYGQTQAMTVSITALGNMHLCSSTIGGYSACP